MPDVFDETFAAFLAQQAAEYRRRLELTEALGLERAGYIRVAGVRTDQIMISPPPAVN